MDFEVILVDVVAVFGVLVDICFVVVSYYHSFGFEGERILGKGNEISSMYV